jgi:hypothetical protein
LSDLACEILQYLERNPAGSDTLVGIARWWIMKQRIEAITMQVEQAVDELVKQEFLIRSSGAESGPNYSLNQQSLGRIRVLLASRKPRL